MIFNGYLNISAVCLMGATVSSIHLAADIPNARVDDQAISYPKMRTVQNRFSNGHTQKLGVESGKTQIVVYDKKAEIIKSNGKLGMYLSEIKEKVPPHDLLRIEIKLTPTSLLDVDLPMGILELSELPNAFSKLRVHAVPTTLSRVERLVLTVARHEGMARALHVAEFDSADKKAFYRELKKAGAPAWWKPEELWEQKFPPLIDEFLKPFMPLDATLPGNAFAPPQIPKVADELTLC
jgi:hypothetical protein